MSLPHSENPGRRRRTAPSNYCIELPAGARSGRGDHAASGGAPAAAHACVRLNTERAMPTPVEKGGTR